MATINEIIERKEYDLIDILHDESDALYNFNDYDGDIYICDAISEIADRYIPIYNNDVWANVSDIQEYVEEAIASGFVLDKDVDLVQVFQAGYYEYYTQSLYNNLDIMAYNYVANKIDDSLNDFSADTIDSLNFGDIEEAIEIETDNFDNNLKFDNLNDIAKRIISDIKAGEFRI